jgi:signal transduction histidine kinase
LLALTALLAAGLGYEAWDASRSHRALARSSVREQAVFAATNFAREARDEVLFDLFEDGVEVVEDASGRDGDRRLTSDRIRQSVRSNRWPASEHARLYYRLRLPEGDFAWLGPEDADLVDWARTSSSELAARRSDDDVRVEFSPKREEVLVSDLSFPARDEAVVYGVAIAPAALGDAFDDAFRGERLLPEASTGGLPNDRMFVARVFGPDERLLYESSPDPTSDIVVRHPLTSELSEMTIQLGVRDEAIALLVSGGLPPSRLPFIVALLVLTSGLLGTAVWQLHREAELAELREDFVSSVSHELRTPLTQIRMFAEMLMLGRVRNEEERTRATEIIVDEATRLTHQVENVLMFSRGERHALRLDPVELDVGELAGEVVEAFAPLAESEGATIRVEAETDVWCFADPDATKQALLNILDNAVKYGPAGQVIEVGVVRDSRRVLLWVEDEGPGIPEGQRARIWDAYVRLDRDRASSIAGSGIGLAVARQVMEAQGGAARVERGRRSAGGARFVLDLPGADTAPV